MKKTNFCIWEREALISLCFRLIDSAMPLLKFQATSHLLGFYRLFCVGPGPEVIKLFSCSTQLSMKFKLLINTEIDKINGNFRFKSTKQVIYPANKC